MLTGAGISTDSGIPDYRDADGAWKQKQPVQFQNFINSERFRQRYWARSMVGWPRFSDAQPNAAHRALMRLERAGHIHQLVTQNVDGLHQQAGSRRVIDLHGRLDTVQCLNSDCRHRLSRDDVQHWLTQHNPSFLQYSAVAVANAPDGDAHLEGIDFSQFQVPPCPRCGGILKPAVVFFGETVPRPRVELALNRLRDAPAVLVVGSSLMVYSGYRFCRAAVAQHKPIAAVNLGRTRADDDLSLKLSMPCATALDQLSQQLT